MSSLACRRKLFFESRVAVDRMEDGYDNYKTAKIVIDQDGEEPLDFAMKVTYRFADDSLLVTSSKDSGWSSVAANPGNVYIVHVNKDGTFDGWQRSDEQIDAEIEAADVERLIATTTE